MKTQAGRLMLGVNLQDIDEPVHRTEVVRYAFGTFCRCVAVRLTVPLAVDDELELVATGRQIQLRLPVTLFVLRHRQRLCLQQPRGSLGFLQVARADGSAAAARFVNNW